MTTPIIFAIDFDGTCVEHRYPDVGPDVPNAVTVLREMAKRGHKLILFTMRSGSQLDDAVEWFRNHGIPLFGTNRNPDQAKWTSSPKAYAQVYIDDSAFGCPLIHPPDKSRPYVDWVEVAQGIFGRKCQGLSFV